MPVRLCETGRAFGNGVGGSGVAQGAGVEVGPCALLALISRRVGVFGSPSCDKIPGIAVGRAKGSSNSGMHPISTSAILNTMSASTLIVIRLFEILVCPYLDAIARAVGDVYSAGLVHGDIVGIVEFAVTGSIIAKIK